MNWKSFSLFLIVLCLLVANWYIKMSLKDQMHENKWLQESELLKQENTALHRKNEILNEELRSLQNQQDSLMAHLNQKSEKMHNLINNKNEKHHIISNHHGDQLYEFFAKFNTDSISQPN